MSNAAPIRAQALRLTRTDACGAPVPEATANSRVTTDGFITVGLAAEVFTSQDIEVIGADGASKVFSKGVSSLRGFNVTIQISDFNLAVLELTGQSSILTDYAAPVELVGGVVHADGSINNSTVMLEWWPENSKNDACAAVAAGGNPRRPYIHMIAPRVNRWVISGNLDFGNQASVITLTAYAEPSTAFLPSRAADEFTAADEADLQANGVLAWREVTALPAITAAGYDL